MPYKTYHRAGLFTTISEGDVVPTDFSEVFDITDSDAVLIKAGAALYVVDGALSIVPEPLFVTPYEPGADEGEIIEGEIIEGEVLP